MSRKKARIEIRPVPSDYTPGYPAALRPDEYRSLVAPRTHRRLYASCLAAGLMLGFTPQEATEDEGAKLERKMLGLMRSMRKELPAWWYRRATFARSADEKGAIVPMIPIMFGNSHEGYFDHERARRIAREVFALYGVELQPDHVVDGEGAKAVLDGYSPERGIGFELRGSPPDDVGMFGRVEVEPADRHLDDDEAKALRAEGKRLHVADVDHYPLMDSDQFTPQLAHLASIVDFLNTVTDGPDLDLTAIVFQKGMEFPPPEQENTLPGGSTFVEKKDGGIECHLPSRGTLRFRYSVPSASPPRERYVPNLRERTEPRVLDGAISTLGSPTVIVFGHYTEESAHPDDSRSVLRVIQARSDLRKTIRVESTRSTVFLPSTFDAARPFTVEVELPAGRHVFRDRLLVGVPAEKD